MSRASPPSSSQSRSRFATLRIVAPGVGVAVFSSVGSSWNGRRQIRKTSGPSSSSALMATLRFCFAM